MADTAEPTAVPAPPQLPLFYQAPQQLHCEVHCDWRLKEGDASFAAETPFVPIVASEFVAAARSYPLVFATDSAMPLAILGLERDNLFLDDGRWASEHYMPAYVRRYPFTFIHIVDQNGFALAIDSGSDRVAQGGNEGVALFEDGQPSTLTQQALEFCAAFGRDAELTEMLTVALREKDLLIDRRADATLPDGRTFGLTGFQIVDADRLKTLDDETVVNWHRSGILALVHHHLASLDRFEALLARQAARGAVTQASRADASAAQAALPDSEDAAPVEPAAPNKKKA